MSLDLDGLLKLANAPPRIERVEAGGDVICVRGLSAADVEEAAEMAGDGDVRPYVLAMALCKEDGTPLCGDAEQHVKRLMKLPAVLVRRLYSAMDKASDVPNGTVGDLAKNSEGRADDSATDSATT